MPVPTALNEPAPDDNRTAAAVAAPTAENCPCPTEDRTASAMDAPTALNTPMPEAESTEALDAWLERATPEMGALPSTLSPYVLSTHREV